MDALEDSWDSYEGSGHDCNERDSSYIAMESGTMLPGLGLWLAHSGRFPLTASVPGGDEGHPFHIHVNSFEVISVDGKPVPPGTIQDTVCGDRLS